MPRNVVTESFILKKKNLPTRDSIITLLTKDFGKLQVFAKGIRTITSKRLPHVQTGNLIQVKLSKSSDRYYLQETALISAFSEIKKDPHKLSFVYLLFFAVDRLFPEGQKESVQYDLIKRFISHLARKNHETSMRELETILNALLVSLGYLDEQEDVRDIEQLKRTIEDLINEKLPFFII